MKKRLLFLFLCMLLCSIFFTFTTHANVSDSLHIPTEELENADIGETDIVIKMYDSPILTFRINAGEHLKDMTTSPWLMLIDDTGIWELSYNGTTFAKAEIVNYCQENYQILAQHMLNPAPLFEKVEKNANFAILETYCFYTAHKLPSSGNHALIYFVTTQGEYVYYNTLLNIPASESNGYLFPYDLFSEIVAAEVYDRRFHVVEGGGGPRLDEVYDLSAYRVHGNQTVELHNHEGDTPIITPDPGDTPENPAPDKSEKTPQKNAFPWGIVLSISLPVIAVGIASGVLVKKKRNKG